MTYKIAQIAKPLGVAPATIRAWEQHGLLTPGRTSSGHRVYRASDLQRARRIAALRHEQGLALSEIRQILAQGPEAGSLAGPGEARARSGGAELRRLRLERGLSIRQLAAALEISPSVISTYERTSGGLGVRALKRLADHFGVTVTALTLSVEPPAPAPVRGHEGASVDLAAGVSTRALATGPKLMDCKEWRIAPGVDSGGAYAHEGEEFVYVLTGVLEITVAGLGTLRLDPRDSLYFDSSREHAWRNPGAEDCTVLWVNSPASF